MIRSSKLPCLPGYSFDRVVGETRFHRSSQCDYIGGTIPYFAETFRPGVGGYPQPWASPDTTPSIYPRRECKELPAWLVFDKQVLTFEAYFQEAMWEVDKSAYQIRKVKIFYYLEDGTIQVSEPKVDNSGMTQGVLIARQRIRYPKPMDGSFYDMIDFNIGRNVELYGRVFRIVDCDNFTRNFLNRMGIFVGDRIAYPVDPYRVEEDKKRNFLVGKRPKKTEVAMGKFLEFDHKSLRFYAYWDDRASLYGFVHKLVVHYFLATGAIEIMEEIPPNWGIDSSAIFLRKAKLPKSLKNIPGPGDEENFTVLNVWPTGFLKGRYIVDPLSSVDIKINYYEEQDLAIGAVLNVYGRKVVLVDCDEFTKQYYRTKYGIDTFEKLKIPGTCEVAETKPKELPPWNGIGTYEDTEGNCLKIVPRVIKKDVFKMLTKGQMGLESHVLRFKARLISVDQRNDERSFIVSFFLSDDEISVYERGGRNTGFLTGYFFKKREFFKPDQDRFVSVKPKTFTKEDFWVGNIIKLEGYSFRLVSADDYCHRYMELHSQEFPKSNIKLILSKIREKLRPVYKDFVNSCLCPCMKNYNNSCLLSFCDLKKALSDLCGDEITEHEIITVARMFRIQGPSLLLPKEKVIDTCQTECRRKLWLGFDRLQEYLLYKDSCRTGYIQEKIAVALCKGAKIPIENELLNEVIRLTEKNECGELRINDLLRFFDTQTYMTRVVVPFNHKKQFSELTMLQDNNDHSWMDCDCFLKEIGLEEELVKEGHTEGKEETAETAPNNIPNIN